MMFRSAALVLLMVLPAACSRDAPPRLEPGVPVEGDLDVTSDNGMLTVAPAIIDLCAHPEGFVAADVRSDATSTGTESSEIWLESDGIRKLWSGSGAVFEGRTGVWLKDGSKVSLVDKRDGNELASITLKANTCTR